MVTATTFTKTGTKSTKKTSLPKEVFATEVSSHSLLHQAYVQAGSNQRSSGARVKTRGQVRGGGAKPWRQKGLGRARAGSIRSPIWRGGGVTFGPTGQENFTKKLNAAAKKRAVMQALTLKAQNDAVVIIEDLSLKEGKTKELKSLIDKLGLERSVLILVDNKTNELTRASANLSHVTLKQAPYVNVKSVIDHDTVLVTKAGLDALVAHLGGKK